MTLSEAIREGAKRRRQCRRDYFRNGASCVIGAAWEGSGGRYDELAPLASRIKKRFRISSEKFDEIVSWNESGMTREQIADKLEAEGL